MKAKDILNSGIVLIFSLVVMTITLNYANIAVMVCLIPIYIFMSVLFVAALEKL